MRCSVRRLSSRRLQPRQAARQPRAAADRGRWAPCRCSNRMRNCASAENPLRDYQLQLGRSVGALGMRTHTAESFVKYDGEHDG